MLTMDQVHDIKIRFYEKGQNISQIAKELNLDWKTVRKYVDMEDFNPQKKKAAANYQVCPKLNSFKETIDQWLEDDKKAPRKQRHTAKRVFARLEEEFPHTFDCSYRTVATYYSVKHKELFSSGKNSYLPLIHQPAEAQVDFGAASFYENGKLCSGKYLEVSFPYSNKGYLQLFYGENLECLLEGLDSIFRHIGFVPKELWFDNTKTIVTKIIRGGGRDLTDSFKRFRSHYGFKSVFMNPGKGHEKGNVENKVGYQRRNLLVPVPSFQSLEQFNREILERCEKDAQRQHYRFNETIESRFVTDEKDGLPLPRVPFDLSRHMTVRTNKWGKFYLYKKLHEYSASPKYSGCVVNLQLTSRLVIVQDENFREIVRHRRLYGDSKQQSMNWLPYLNQLSKRPRALKYSGIYDLMPATMKQYLDQCSNTDTGKILKVLSDLTDRTGFDSALSTVEEALRHDVHDTESLKNLYRRTYAGIPELPPISLGSDLPKLNQMSANLAAYDELLQERRPE